MFNNFQSDRAVLIQDISDVVYVLSGLMRGVLEDYINWGVNEEDALEWYIREEIENIYCLFDEHHRYKNEPYRTIHSLVKNKLTSYNDRLIAAYIKVPFLTGDNSNVHIELRSQDLYIWYTKK